MSILTELDKQIIDDDGNYKTFVLHKLAHVFIGCLGALVVLHSGVHFIGALLVALILGVLRELQKTTGELLHVVTALITMSGAFVAVLLVHQTNTVQLVISGLMLLYCAIIVYMQEKNIDL